MEIHEVDIDSSFAMVITNMLLRLVDSQDDFLEAYIMPSETEMAVIDDYDVLISIKKKDLECRKKS